MPTEQFINDIFDATEITSVGVGDYLPVLRQANGERLLRKTKAVNYAASLSFSVSQITATGMPGPTTFLRGDGAWATVAGSGGVWGTITGMLADQSDLNTALGLKASIAYVDAAIVGLLDDRGNYDASVNTFPASGGSGTAGAVLKGDLWTISVAGTLGGHPVTAGDVVRALTDTPGQTDGNWAISENNFGYVAENSANKVTAFSTPTDVQYASAKLTFDQLALKANLSSPSFTTPTLGVAAATSINKVTITQPATGAILTIPDGVTLNAGAGGTLGSNAFTSTAYAPIDNPTFTTNIATPAASIGFGATAPPSGPLLAVATTISTSPRGIASMQFSTDTSGARVGFFKARGTVASPTTVVTGDTLGRLMFRGYDGSNYLEMGSIEAVSTGTIASTRVPTQLIFSTATNATPSVLTTALTLNADQSATFAGDVLPTSTQNLGNATLPWLTTFTGSTTQYGKWSTSAGLVSFDALGSATNIGLTLSPKGSGNLTLAVGSGTVLVTASTANAMLIGGSLIRAIPTYAFSFSSSTALSDQDIGFQRIATGVAVFSDGLTATNRRWFQWAGQARMTADATNATATFSNLTDLTISNLQAGRKYTGRMTIKCINSTATEGIQFDFNGGTATMTNFFAAAGILSSGGTDVIGTSISTSLAGVINFTTFTGESVVVFDISFVVNGAGTLLPRFAENSSAVGTATVRLGSFIILNDSPN